MRKVMVVGVAALVLGSGCGLEILVGNAWRDDYLRPASVIRGTVVFPDVAKVQVTDADGVVLEPFETHFDRKTGEFEMRLPSAPYSMLYVTETAGNMSLRAIVPSVGEEDEVDGVVVDTRSTAVALLTEAKLSAQGIKLKALTPDVYAATAALMRAAIDEAGPTQDLFTMMEKLVNEGGNLQSENIAFFLMPEVADDFTVTTSPIDKSWIGQTLFDYDNDGRQNRDSSVFDAKLVEAAKLFEPAGCPDPDRIRLVFAVDFNDGLKDGNCANISRFKWATDKPGKQMFFVGWLHKDSPIQDPSVQASLGNGVPNQIPMHDDGTNGDEVGGDNVWTVFFDVPRGARIGYKYTWGFRGAVWTGSEEWPGNSHIIQVEDVVLADGPLQHAADNIVYRSDNFGDEATNKDNGNLSKNGMGTITWETDLNGDGVPEARENPIDTNGDCRPDAWFKPTAVGPLTQACTQ